MPWLLTQSNHFGDLENRANLERLLEEFVNLHAIRRIAPDLSIPVDNVKEPSFYGVIDSVYGKLAREQKGFLAGWKSHQ